MFRVKKIPAFPAKWIKAVALCSCAVLFYFCFQHNWQNNPAIRTPAPTPPQISTLMPDEVVQGTVQWLEYDNTLIHQGNLILVNSQHQYDPDQTKDLCRAVEYKTHSYKIKDKSTLISKSITEPLNNMMNAFEKQWGSTPIMVMNGFRNRATQEKLFYKYQTLSKKAGGNPVSPPGCSEHHTGYAFDFSLFSDLGISSPFKGTGKYEWFEKNCWKYGFILRYPKKKEALTQSQYNPEHYRYVGTPHSQIIKEKQLCLEEYIAFIRQYEYSIQHLIFKESSDVQYEIYYVPAGKNQTKIPAPTNRTYSISGNNTDGFIVTVAL